MPNVIKIKRSTGSTAPTSLSQGELAYAEGSSILYIGTSGASLAQVGLALGSTAVQTAAGTYTFTGNVTFSGTVGMGAVTATAPAGTDNSSRVATTAWVRTYAEATYLPLAGGTVSGNLTVGGNLTVNGTVTSINSTTISVDDINIVLGDTASPTNATADGGGITLKGTTDKTLNWLNSINAWTSSEDFNLVTGKIYEINGVSVLSATTLGSGVVNSSLTSVGTLTSGSLGVGFTTVAVARGGTGATSLTGIVKGNGTSAFSAAVAGTDYLDPNSTIDGGYW